MADSDRASPFNGETSSPSSRHYPLNELDLSFSKYHHHQLTSADIIAHHLWARFFDPAFKDKRDHCTRIPCDSGYADIRKLQDRDLFLDIEVLQRSQVSYGGGLPANGAPYGEGKPREPWKSVREIALDVAVLAALRRHVLETSHPEMRHWLMLVAKDYIAWPFGQSSPVSSLRDLDKALTWDDIYPQYEFGVQKEAQLRHLTNYAPPLLRQHANFLFSRGPVLQHLRVDFIYSHWFSDAIRPIPHVPDERDSRVGRTLLPNRVWKLPPQKPGHELPGTLPRRLQRIARDSRTADTRRSVSEPSRGEHMPVLVQNAYVAPGPLSFLFRSRQAPPIPLQVPSSQKGYSASFRDMITGDDMIFFVPCPSLSTIDHRLRRRSLSRRHIANMFHDPPALPDVSCDEAMAHPSMYCGWCASPKHISSACDYPKHARCKCRAFPIYHTAKTCPIVCSRRCGNIFPLGSGRHPRAMTCRSRCCMCGLPGHSGAQCRLKKCRCGGSHLGQDCGWNPACRVKGCPRYLCGLHCRECGSSEKPFVGWRCAKCLVNEDPVGGKAEEWQEEQSAVADEKTSWYTFQRLSGKRKGRKRKKDTRKDEAVKTEG